MSRVLLFAFLFDYAACAAIQPSFRTTCADAEVCERESTVQSEVHQLQVKRPASRLYSSCSFAGVPASILTRSYTPLDCLVRQHLGGEYMLLAFSTIGKNPIIVQRSPVIDTFPRTFGVVREVFVPQTVAKNHVPRMT